MSLSLNDSGSILPCAHFHNAKNSYIEYRPGSLNLIITVPHGGQLRPKFLPNRDFGSRVDGGEIRYDHRYPKDAELPVKTKSDLRTVELAAALERGLETETGRRPHVVINHLHRVKLDCNCGVEEGAFGVGEAVATWNAFHESIETAIRSLNGGAGLVLDLHGHLHPEGWVELGYGVPGRLLDSRRYLPSNTLLHNLHTRLLSSHRPSPPQCAPLPPSIAELVAGPQSLGGLLSHIGGYTVVPSPGNPGPGGGKYFSGGYNVLRYGSRRDWLDAIQVESPGSCREPEVVERYGTDLGRAVAAFLNLYYK